MPKIGVLQTKNCMFDCVWRGGGGGGGGGGGVRFTGNRQPFHYKIQISYPILGITFHNGSSVDPLYNDSILTLN